MSILSDRYASPAMKEIWSAESKIRAERNLWISVMKAQAKLGFDIPASAIAEYEKVKDKVDLRYGAFLYLFVVTWEEGI